MFLSSRGFFGVRLIGIVNKGLLNGDLFSREWKQFLKNITKFNSASGDD